MKKIKMFLLLALSVLLSAPVSAQYFMETRKYETNEWGMVTLQFIGNKVKGTFLLENKSGKIDCTQEGMEARGSWNVKQKKDGLGNIIITFSDGYKSFEAKHNTVKDMQSWPGQLSGKLISEEFSFTKYETPWGILSIVTTDGKVQGYFANKESGKGFKGTFSKNLIKGKWYNNGNEESTGNIEIQFSKNFRTFEGKYTLPGENEWKKDLTGTAFENK